MEVLLLYSVVNGNLISLCTLSVFLYSHIEMTSDLCVTNLIYKFLCLRNMGRILSPLNSFEYLITKENEITT